MNKRGITFVGATLCIALIALMIVFLAPKLFGTVDSKKPKVFITTSQSIINNVAQTYIQRQDRVYSNLGGYTTLDKDFGIYKYYLKVSNNGNVEYFKITNGQFKVEGSSQDKIDPTKIGTEYEVVMAQDKMTFEFNTQTLEIEEKIK